MCLNINLNKNLFYTHLDVENSNELLEIMGTNLIELGYVKEKFTESIIKRESIYPTGLPSGKISIAIPHTDKEMVNTTTISVATLKNPVLFKSMAAPDQDIEVAIVFMLAISEPEGQLEMLQKVMDIIQDTDFKEKILNIQSNSDLLGIIKNRLGGE